MKKEVKKQETDLYVLITSYQSKFSQKIYRERVHYNLSNVCIKNEKMKIHYYLFDYLREEKKTRKKYETLWSCQKIINMDIKKSMEIRGIKKNYEKKYIAPM